MRGKKLLALLLCLAVLVQMIPAAFAEEPESFSVYAPDEIDFIVGTDGTVTVSPENPAIYNGMKTKPAAVTGVQIKAKDGWTLVPFGTDFSDEESARLIGVSLNGEEIAPSGTLDLSERPWVVPADSRLPLDLSVNIPSGLAKEDVEGILTIQYTFDWAEVTDGDHTHTLTPVDGEHGTIADKTPIRTDKNGVVQDNLPGADPDDGYAFDKWVDENGNEVKPGDVLDRDVTITPTFTPVMPEFTVEYRNGLMLPDSHNTATFKWDHVPDNFELASVTSSDPSIADVEEVFDCAAGTQMIGVKANKRGIAKFTGVSTTGETASFDVQVSELSASAEPAGSVNSSNSIHAGDTIKPEDITISIPVVTPDGTSGSVTMVPNKVSNNLLSAGENTISATVDVNGVTIVINITINVTSSQGSGQEPPVTPTDKTYTLTPIDGANGTVPNKTPVKTDSSGVVQDNLPGASPEDGYEFVMWTDADSGKEIKPGDTLSGDITIKPVFREEDNTHTITPIDGDHGTVPDKTPVETDRKGVVQDNLPEVTPADGYALSQWVNVEDGRAVKPGDVLNKDITIKPVFSEKGLYKVFFETASYYDISDTTPLHSTRENKIPMEQMPDTNPTVASHYFDGEWVNAETGETVDENTVLTSDITVKPEINCLFTEKNGAVTGFSEYAADKNVAEITIPNTIMGKPVSKIGKEAFAYLYDPQTVENGVIRYKMNDKVEEINTVTISEGITSIGDNAFYSIYDGCLETVHLPDGLKTIGEKAFASCDPLSSCDIPDTVTSIGAFAFNDCAISSVVIPDSVTSLGKCAFMYTPNLSEVHIGRGIKTLPEQCFSGCKSLAEIEIPETITALGKGCFQSSGLEYIWVPNSVKTLGESVFLSCESLVVAEIGTGVKSIGGYMFQSCSNLVRVSFLGRITSIADTSNGPAFYNCPSIRQLLFPSSAKSFSRNSPTTWGCKTDPCVGISDEKYGPVPIVGYTIQMNSNAERYKLSSYDPLLTIDGTIPWDDFPTVTGVNGKKPTPGWWQYTPVEGGEKWTLIKEGSTDKLTCDVVFAPLMQ